MGAKVRQGQGFVSGDIALAFVAIAIVVTLLGLGLAAFGLKSRRAAAGFWIVVLLSVLGVALVGLL